MRGNDKEILVDIFNDTLEQCQTNDILKDAVQSSIDRQYILLDGDSIELKAELYSVPANIKVSAKRTLEAAEQYKDSKVCILNFASSKNPGGGVVNGAKAQEECICRITTLYPCLASDKILNGFYLPHRTIFSNLLYNDDLIFTPDVYCIKTDTASPEPMSAEDWFKVDVITCAAPNLSGYTRVYDDTLAKIQFKRLERVFITAANSGAETLILGAFGCGAFRNPPKVVAKVMKDLTDKYSCYFKNIEFAVYCSSKNPTNYDVFRDAFVK